MREIMSTQKLRGVATSSIVHSGAGGVGGALVQIAKRLQCRVIAVVGAPHKVAVARQAGADHVIDKSTQALWPRVRQLAPWV